MAQGVKVAIRGREGEGGKFADKGGSELRDPVDVTTGQGAEESRDGGRAERAMVISYEAGEGERAQREKGSRG